jgi:hypothetical protein
MQVKGIVIEGANFDGSGNLILQGRAAKAETKTIRGTRYPLTKNPENLIGN